MDSEKIITFQLQLTRRKAWLLLTVFFICWRPGFLGSETLTLTTYYPAPYGGYASLLTTGKTLLARNGGNVGIGIASPTGKLHVEGTGDVIFRTSGRLDVGSPAQLRGAPGGTGLYVDSSGRVGINTLAPTQRLEIFDGNLNISGDGATTGFLTGICASRPYSGNDACPPGMRVMAVYGTISCTTNSMVFLGGDLDDSSRWRPYPIEGCAGTMLCCRILDGL